MKLEIFRIETSRGVSDNIDAYDKVFDLLMDESKNNKYFLERGHKYRYLSMDNKMSNILLWVYESNGASHRMNVNISVRNNSISEIFVIGYANIKLEPKPHFLKIDYEYNSRNRTEAAKATIDFINVVTDKLEESKYAPIMEKKKWKTFIEPYEYYKSLKVELMNKDFFVIDTKGTLESENKKVLSYDAYLINNRSEADYRFKSNDEVAKFKNVSLHTKTDKIINVHEEIFEVSIEDNEMLNELNDRIKFLKINKNLNIYASKAKDKPLLTDSSLSNMTEYRKSRDLVGIDCEILEDNKTIINTNLDNLSSLSRYLDLIINKNNLSEIEVLSNLKKKFKEWKKNSKYDLSNLSEILNNYFVTVKDKRKIELFIRNYSSNFEYIYESLNNLISEVDRFNSEYDVDFGKIEEEWKDDVNYKKEIINRFIESQKDLDLCNSKLVSSRKEIDKLIKKSKKSLDNQRLVIEKIEGLEDDVIALKSDLKNKSRNYDELISKSKEEINEEEIHFINEYEKNSKELKLIEIMISNSNDTLYKEKDNYVTINNVIDNFELDIKKIESKIDELTKEVKFYELESEEAKNDITKINENFEMKKNKLEIERFNSIEFETKKQMKTFEMLIELSLESSKIEVFEFKTIFKFKYFMSTKDNDDRFFYLLEKQSVMLLNTIYSTIRKIQRNGMNNEIVKMIADEKVPISNQIIRPKPNNSKFKLNGGELNDEQKIAFDLAIDMSNKLSVIQGPPGTGKTEVITRLIKYFRDNKQKVILSSQSNEAIQNVIEKLLNDNTGPVFSRWAVKKPNFLYSTESISKTLYEKTFADKVNKINRFGTKNNGEINDVIKSSIEELRGLETSPKGDAYLSDYNLNDNSYLMGATTTTSATSMGINEEFVEQAEVLIIDEVSKSYLVEILRYSIATNIKKVILVGDYKQLPPLFDLRSDDFKDWSEVYLEKEFNDIKEKINKGVFANITKKADKVGLNTQLVTNYRSIEEILDSYKIFYANSEIGTSKELKPFRTNDSQLEKTMEKYNFPKSGNFFIKNTPRYFVDIDSTKLDSGEGNGYSNLGERDMIVSALENLLKIYKEPTNKSLGLIFMYAKQLKKFKSENSNLINKLNRIFTNGFRINTVDGFQGSESDIIFVSTTVLSSVRNRTFLSNYRRINVALSRAKDVLVIFGSESYLSNLLMDRDDKEKGKYMREVIKQIKESPNSKYYPGEAW